MATDKKPKQEEGQASNLEIIFGVGVILLAVVGFGLLVTKALPILFWPSEVNSALDEVQTLQRDVHYLKSQTSMIEICNEQLADYLPATTSLAIRNGYYVECLIKSGDSFYYDKQYKNLLKPIKQSSVKILACSDNPSESTRLCSSDNPPKCCNGN